MFACMLCIRPPLNTLYPSGLSEQIVLVPEVEGAEPSRQGPDARQGSAREGGL